MQRFIFDPSKGETQASLTHKRRIAETLMAGNRRTPTNIGEGLEAIGRALQARGIYKSIEKAEKASRQRAEGGIAEIVAAMGGTPFPPAPGRETSPGQAQNASPHSGNAIYSEFMDTVRNGGVTNPNALAAIAATGQRESSFSEGNAFGTWSDPSQGGEAGTAGGVMSWRGPRLAALQKFAQENGGDANRPSAALQAQFLLQEDPQLIEQLQAAQNPDQAQQLMNAAWRFAGYDQPGGETAERLKLANSYASQFQPTKAPEESGISSVAQALNPQQPDPYRSETLGAQPINTQTGPDLGMLVRVAGNDFLNDAQRSVVNYATQRYMDANDPDKRLAREKAQIELDKLRRGGDAEFKVVGDQLLKIGADGAIADVTPQAAGPGAGQFRFQGKSVEAQSLNGLMDANILTPEQAQQLGAGKTVSGPNGEILFLTPQGVFGQHQNGQPQPLTPQAGAPVAGADTTRPGLIPLTEPKTTLDERKAAGFADRMGQSGELLNTFGNAGLSVKDQFIRGNDYIPDFAENWLVSNDFQNFDQARRDFINAQLRRESGAVISDEEFDNANRQYFPQPGDNESVLKQKRTNRETVINGMKRDAGPTYEAPTGDIPSGAIDMLKADPSLADQFDAKFGRGAARRVLGAQ